MKFTCVLAVMFCLNAPVVSAATAEEDKTSDEAIVLAAEKMMKEGGADAKALSASGASPSAGPAAVTTAAVENSATPPPPLPTAEPKESDIPLFLESKKADKGLASVAWRLGASLALIGVVGGAMIYASKRWGRTKDKGGNQARIEMMHQFHMGPRKSLALVRVAGEVVLLGVTDHNINLIKPVTLIDGELEGVLGKDFNGFLEDEFSVEDVRSALNARV